MINKYSKARNSSRQITFRESSQGLTSQAGLIPVVKFMKLVGIDAALSELVHERGSNAFYQLSDVLIFAATGVVGGARNLDGISRVCSDYAIMKALNWNKICNPTTMARIAKKTGFKENAEIEQVMHDIRQKVWRHIGTRIQKKCFPAAEMTVDIDSTVKTVYGNQQGARKGYNSEKGKKSFHPQLAFCAETKEILQAWLRSGDAYTSNGITDFYNQLRAGIDANTRLLIRCDSGYFSGTFFDACEANGDGYLVKVKMKNLVDLLERQEWSTVTIQETFDQNKLESLQWKAVEHESGWEQATFEYKCGSWTKARKFVAVRREKENQDKTPKLFDIKEYDYFCYVTTENETPWETHKKYTKRATCETWVEEAKNQTALGHIKTDNFWANSVFFQACVLAYNLIRWIALASEDKKLKQMEPETIRCFFIRVAGKLLSGSRQLKLVVPKHVLYPNLWQRWLAAAGIILIT